MWEWVSRALPLAFVRAMREVAEKAAELRRDAQAFSGAVAYGAPVEIVKDRLYFHTVEGSPKSSATTTMFSVDGTANYESFYNDFGPLNLAVLYRYCTKVRRKLGTTRKRLMHYTGLEPKRRVNAAFLAGAYAIVYDGADPDDLWRRLSEAQEPPALIGFRDAAMGPSSYDLALVDVWRGLHKALRLRWLDFAHFDVEEYEYYERVETGDLNWIVPDKFLAFCGPHKESVVENGYPYHAPDVYFDYFREHNVSTIIRLNKKVYDAAQFTDAGFRHVDLFFVDGSTPSDSIVRRFLDSVDESPGAAAVHCKAGLGRTGTLIGCWMMREHGLTAAEVMGWCRVCRPGSIIGPQQAWLIDKQEWCWELGRKMGKKHFPRSLPSPPKPLALPDKAKKPPSILKRASPQGNGMLHLASKVDHIRLDRGVQPEAEETALNEAGQSQGDRLLAIKAAKAAAHPHPLTRPPIHHASLAANPRFTSPTTPVKPPSAAGLSLPRPGLAALREEREPSGSPSSRRLDFAPNPSPPRTNSLPRKVPKVAHHSATAEAQTSSPKENKGRKSDSNGTPVGQPPKIFRTRASTSGLGAKGTPSGALKKSSVSQSVVSSGGRRKGASPASSGHLRKNGSPLTSSGVRRGKSGLVGAATKSSARGLRASGPALIRLPKPADPLGQAPKALAKASTTTALPSVGKSKAFAKGPSSKPYFLRSRKSLASLAVQEGHEPTPHGDAHSLGRLPKSSSALHRHPRKVPAQRGREARELS